MSTANGLVNSPVALNEPSTLFIPMLATAIVASVLTTGFISIRLYTKYQTRMFALEDYLLILAWLCYIGYNTTMAVGGKVGVGHYLWYVPGSVAFDGLKYPWALELVFSVLMVAARTALILQLIRIFAPTRRGTYYWIFQAIIWVNILFYIAVESALFANCIPLHKVWRPLTPGKCINAQGLLVAVSIVNIVSDFIALVVPIIAIWHLQMAVKRKLGSSLVFAVGVIALVSSLGRTVYSFRSYYNKTETYSLGQVSIWSMAEVGALILVTCFPVLPRFFQIVSGKMSTYGKSYGKSSGHPSIKLQEGPFGTNGSDRTALTDPETGKGVPATGSAAAAWGGKRSKLGTAANPTFQEMMDGDTLGGAESSGSISDGSLGMPTKPSATAEIKRTISVDLSTQYVPKKTRV